VQRRDIMQAGAALAWPLLLGSLGQRSSQAAVITNDTNVPIAEALGGSPILFDDCTGEDVELSGDVHTLIRTTVDSRGGIHVGASFSASDVNGVGLSSGNTYQFHGNQNFEFNTQPPYPYEATLLLTNFGLTSRGSDDNLAVTLYAHFTINANGEVTADFFRPVVKCKG
jgi:hypothetical protein